MSLLFILCWRSIYEGSQGAYALTGRAKASSAMAQSIDFIEIRNTVTSIKFKDFEVKSKFEKSSSNDGVVFNVRNFAILIDILLI